MSEYPTDREDRERARSEAKQRANAKAEREARVSGRSMKCSGGQWEAGPIRHAGDPEGCKGGPRNCLCECHDGEQPS